MIRKSFTQKLSRAGICPFVIQNLSGSELITYAINKRGKDNSILHQKQFAECWRSDPLDSNAKCLDCTHNTHKSIFENNTGGPSVQNPDALTTSGQFSCSNHKYFNNKDLIPAKDGQITPAKDGQRHWLFQQGLLCMKIRLT